MFGKNKILPGSVALVLIPLLIPSPVRAQSTILLTPSNEPRHLQWTDHPDAALPRRPRIGLVLSGGGSRGLAQIGVLKSFERHHIPIDLIVGNSLGSVVAGLYASGYSPAEIESIAVHTNWSELLSFTEETKRTDLYIGQKQSQEEGFLLIRFDGLQPIIPSSISGGQRISNFFSYLSLQALYHPNPTFDGLKIPLRITSTDLLSGKRVIMDRGSLAEAMRASVAVPLLYSPLERDSMFLVDGGLVSNIPADVARSLGCDVVVVVNSTSSLRRPDQMAAPWEIADQIMTIMMQLSNKEEMKLADVVITPPGANRIVSDFSGIDTLMDGGERAADQAIPQIRAAIAAGSARLRLPASDAGDSIAVRFEGDPVPDSIRNEILREDAGHPLVPASIQAQLDTLAATGRYRELAAEIRDTAGGAEILYRVVTRSPLVSARFAGNVLLPDSLINRQLEPLYEHPVSDDDIRNALERVLRLYRDRGNSLARIDSVRIDPVSRTISFSINEGRIYQIKYEGNDQTRDYVIRREFPMDVGDIFDIERANQGIVNIKSTGLFDYVLLDVRYVGTQPVIVLKVKEKSSELLRLGLHADDEHGVVATTEIRDANFRGAWEDFGVTARFGSRDRGVRLGYTINRIFNTYFTMTLQGYLRSRDILTYKDDPTLSDAHWDRLEDGRYRDGRYGGCLAFGSHVERLGEVTGELRWENQKISGISGEGYVPEQYNFAALKLQSIIDNQDKYPFPEQGMYFMLSYESALRKLGSEVAYGKLTVSYETYLTFLPGHTLRPKISFGFADANLPIAEQYSLGGFNSFYGLREDDSRGRQLFLINMEYRYRFPFRLVFETYVEARYDLGTISRQPQELTFSHLRHGAGLSIALDTPIGQASVGMGKSFFFRTDLPNSPISVGPLLFYFSIGAPL